MVTKVLFVHNLSYFVVNKTKIITLLYKYGYIFCSTANQNSIAVKYNFIFTQAQKPKVCGIPSAFFQCEILSLHQCNSPLLLAKLG